MPYNQDTKPSADPAGTYTRPRPPQGEGMTASQWARHFENECKRCGHVWVPRVLGSKPLTCPKCQSPYWRWPKGETPRLKSTVEIPIRVTCKRCGNTWNRKNKWVVPRVCPRCHSPYWRRWRKGTPLPQVQEPPADQGQR